MRLESFRSLKQNALLLWEGQGMLGLSWVICIVDYMTRRVVDPEMAGQIAKKGRQVVEPRPFFDLPSDFGCWSRRFHFIESCSPSGHNRAKLSLPRLDNHPP